MRHFLSLKDFSKKQLWSILVRAKELKAFRNRERLNLLSNKIIALLFEKPSTRTRVSFEVGIKQLGGDTIFLGKDEVGLGKREEVKDVARTLSRYVSGVIIRTFEHNNLLEFAEFSSVPVINALTDFLHPCQALSDIFTLWERFSVIEDITLCFIGDGNNVLHSLIFASAQFGFRLNIITPKNHLPSPVVLKEAKKIALANMGFCPFSIYTDLKEGLKDADVIYTDVWVSMGQEKDAEIKKRDFYNYQLNSSLLRPLDKEVLIMHCLPAHRGEEITDDVIESENSIVFDQAENRLHLQKAILDFIYNQI